MTNSDECEDVKSYKLRAWQARLELEHENKEHPWSPYKLVLERKLDAAIAGSYRARSAHQMGKCSCRFRTGVTR